MSVEHRYDFFTRIQSKVNNLIASNWGGVCWPGKKQLQKKRGASALADDVRAQKTMDKFNIEDLKSTLPSVGDRSIAKKSTRNSRGAIVVELPGRNRRVVMWFESKLEQRVFFLLLANSKVWNLKEQCAFNYIDEEGRPRTHFFDVLVTLECGKKIACTIKPAGLVTRDFLRLLRQLCLSLTKDFADEIELITDNRFTIAEALNAERYLAFRKYRDDEVMQELLALVTQCEFPVTIGQLQQQLGKGAGGFRAIVIAIYERLLRTDLSIELDASSLLHKGEGS